MVALSDIGVTGLECPLVKTGEAFVGGAENVHAHTVTMRRAAGIIGQSPLPRKGRRDVVASRVTRRKSHRCKFQKGK
jgi:hypothetical protein